MAVKPINRAGGFNTSTHQKTLNNNTTTTPSSGFLSFFFKFSLTFKVFSLGLFFQRVEYSGTFISCVSIPFNFIQSSSIPVFLAFKLFLFSMQISITPRFWSPLHWGKKEPFSLFLKLHTIVWRKLEVQFTIFGLSIESWHARNLPTNSRIFLCIFQNR